MGLFNFFKKQTQTRSPLEKFEAIKASVKLHTKSLTDDNYDSLNSKGNAAKAIFQTIDKIQRQKMGDEQKNKLDKLDAIKHVLDILETEVSNGHINEVELQEILNSKEFKDYTQVDPSL